MGEEGEGWHVTDLSPSSIALVVLEMEESQGGEIID